MKKIRYSELFRKNARALMDRDGITVRELGRRLNTSHSYVNNVLTGKISPSMDRCEDMAAALGTTLIGLLRRND